MKYRHYLQVFFIDIIVELIALCSERYLLNVSMKILYRHSCMFVAGIYNFTGWIPAKNIPE